MTALQVGYVRSLPRCERVAAHFFMLISHPCFPTGPTSLIMKLLRIFHKTRQPALAAVKLPSTIIARYALPARIA